MHGERCENVYFDGASGERLNDCEPVKAGIMIASRGADAEFQNGPSCDAKTVEFPPFRLCVLVSVSLTQPSPHPRVSRQLSLLLAQVWKLRAA